MSASRTQPLESDSFGLSRSETARFLPELLPPVIETRRLPRMAVVNRTDFILGRCEGKTVLHLGAVDQSGAEVGGLHRRLLEVAEQVVGIDKDAAGILLAREQGIEDIVEGDIEELDTLSLSGFRPDIILASEVLEHLSSPGRFLHSVKPFFSPNTQMIVTTPNCFSAYRFLYPLLATEIAHSEHVAYHSYATLTNLMSRFGYRILERYGYILAMRPMRVLRGLFRMFPHFASGYVLVVRHP